MYSAASSHSSIRSLRPRLSRMGLPASRGGDEELEVLRIARADLEDVGVLGDFIDVRSR